MRPWSIALQLIALARSSIAIGQIPSINFDPLSGALRLASRNSSVRIFVDGADWPAVLRAADDLSHDFGRVVGTNGSLNSFQSGNNTVHPISKNDINHTFSNISHSIPYGGAIIIGSIDRSNIITKLAEEGKINLEGIRGKWESFISAVVASPTPEIPNALVIAGSDRRGTVYGIYDISEQIGVSPWHWFADVPYQRHNTIYAVNSTKVQGSPSVKYRGFFINDEAPALTGWMNSKYPKSKYGSAFGADFYAHVFELLLRLRANYLWPAMWDSMFNVDDPKNQAMADEYGIVMGTSHTEPMMRATKEQTHLMAGPWQWDVNNASMHEFMQEGAKRARPYESVFTMGARGNHDTALNGGDAINQLENIFKAERLILDEVFGDSKKVPQVWTLYTEVQSYYDDDGLKVPNDITLLFSDDNYGNLRRLPFGNETDRPGGSGVYYHFDYVGPPRSYKWINTIQLQRTWEQMTLAYQAKARTIWMVNVGDIKPLEIPINHFFDLAYNISLYEKPNSTKWWLREWAAREFGPQHAEDIAEVVMKYSNLAGRRKFELVEMNTYSVINYQEGESVLDEWNSLAAKSQKISDSLQEEARAAFFEMVLHPVLAGGTVHDIAISSAKNQLYAFQGRNSANLMAEHVMQKWKYDYDLKEKYNELRGGKWKHMADQPHFYNHYWQQPMRQISPQLQYLQSPEASLSGEMGIAIEGSNASVPGDDQFHPNSANYLTLLPMDMYGTHRWIDVFAQGANAFIFNISAEPFVQVTKYSGEISLGGNSTDVRIFVTIDWKVAPPGSGITRINITSSNGYGTQYDSPYLLLPYKNTAVPASFTSGFVESDATVSIEAEHYSRITSSSSFITYMTIPDYGKTLSGVVLSNRTAPSLKLTSAPGLEYDFYTFTSTTMARPANVTLILGQSLNSIPGRPLKYAIAIDDHQPKTVQYILDRPKGAHLLGWPNGMPVGWEKAVVDSAWTSTTSFALGPGKHTLKFWALEPAVILQKIIVDLGGVRVSYLGPPESYRVGTRA